MSEDDLLLVRIALMMAKGALVQAKGLLPPPQRAEVVAILENLDSLLVSANEGGRVGDDAG